MVGQASDEHKSSLMIKLIDAWPDFARATRQGVASIDHMYTPTFDVH